MSNLKLEDGFYWAKFIGLTGGFAAEIVFVFDGFVHQTENGGVCVIEDFDFGPNPQPEQKPEWCK